MKERELNFTDKHFQRIRAFITKQTGIVINESKVDMVYGRLSRHVRQKHGGSFDAFCEAFESNTDNHQEILINAITTNLTAFFREKHHFSYLQQQVFPYLLKANKVNQKIRIWSAGCSTGEEPYSIAMTIMQAIPDWRNWDIRILATDLDSNVVETGRAGVYSQERLSGVNESMVRRFFFKGKGDQAGLVSVRPELKELVTFKRLNLLHEWPMRGSFDLIFCRNVVIYFDKETQRKLFQRYADILAPQGHLFIGHSESLHNISDAFENLGQTIYRKLPV